MKVQLQPGSLRLRLAEAELAQLLQGQPLQLDLVHGQATLFALELRLHEAPSATGTGFELELDAATRQWRLTLSAPVLVAYAATLPRRDALVLEQAPHCGEAGRSLTLLFEIDVRDSVRRRMASGAANPGQ